MNFKDEPSLEILSEKISEYEESSKNSVSEKFHENPNFKGRNSDHALSKKFKSTFKEVSKGMSSEHLPSDKNDIMSSSFEGSSFCKEDSLSASEFGGYSDKRPKQKLSSFNVDPLKISTENEKPIEGLNPK
jgi:hypothetical protein